MRVSMHRTESTHPNEPKHLSIRFTDKYVVGQVLRVPLFAGTVTDPTCYPHMRHHSGRVAPAGYSYSISLFFFFYPTQNE